MRDENERMKLMNLYTIGFTKKSAEEFFGLLKNNKVTRLVDVRLNNTSQLAGFTKENDLKFFLRELCGITYTHDIELAPADSLMGDYKGKKINREQFEQLFYELLEERNVGNKILDKYRINLDGLCLLCSEADAKECHRRLVAEFIKSKLKDDNIKIIHL